MTRTKNRFIGVPPVFPLQDRGIVSRAGPASQEVYAFDESAVAANTPICFEPPHERVRGF